jgi:hypothetical protein
MQSGDVTKESPARKPRANASSESPETLTRGTAADGLGMIQLRVALAQLRKEGRQVELSTADDGSLIVGLPEMRWTQDGGKTRIEWK